MPSVRSPLFSLGIIMFSMFLSRRVSTRVLVQAFTTRSNGVASRSVFLGTNKNYLHRPFSSARGVAAEVDEDLDSALDSLLGDAIKGVEEKESNEPHMKDSKPVPSKLVETVSIYIFHLEGTDPSLTLQSYFSSPFCSSFILTLCNRSRWTQSILMTRNSCQPVILAGWKLDYRRM